jgi:hypothetical protein
MTNNLVEINDSNLNVYKSKVLKFADELKESSFHNCKKKCKPNANACSTCNVPTLRKEVVDSIKSTTEQFSPEGLWVFNMTRLKENYVLLKTNQVDKLKRFLQDDALRAIGFEKADKTTNTLYYVEESNGRFVVSETTETKVSTKRESQSTLDDVTRKDIFNKSVFKNYSNSYLKYYKNKASADKLCSKLNSFIDDEVLQVKRCKDCGEMFILDAGDILYFNKKKQVPHIRCEHCRQVKKDLMQSRKCPICGSDYKLSNIYHKLPEKKSEWILKCNKCLTADDLKAIKVSDPQEEIKDE